MRAAPALKACRFGLLVFRELRVPLGIATALVLTGAAVLAASYDLPYLKACYAVFMLMLAEPTLEFPDQGLARFLFFAFPLLGLGALADSLVRLGYLVFTSKRKLQEWWIMEASTYRDHIVVCGLGSVGYGVVQELRALKEPLVVIDHTADNPLAGELVNAGIPVIVGEIRLRQTLEKANIAHARAVILATSDDLANLDGALTAREIRPDIRVVMRLFDDTLARKVASAFQLPAISPSYVCAPAFVAAATGRAVLHAFQLDGRTHHVSDLQVARLAGRTASELQRDFGAAVVLHKAVRCEAVSPDPSRPLEIGDRIVLVAPMERFRALEDANRESPR